VDYAVAGVRKNLYVWSVTSRALLKVLDAHFGRIIQLEALTIGAWNSVITSSIDRSVKIWNINNIFEQVHVIDRHELQIDSISLSENGELAVTVTRGCVGVWEIRTGRLLSRLADSPLGAIVTHAEITPNGRYIVSSETGKILVWNRVTEQVLARDTQPGIQQINFLEHGDKYLTVSCPQAASGTSAGAAGGGSGAGTGDDNGIQAHAIVRSLPEGAIVFSYDYPVRLVPGLPFRCAVISADGQHILCASTDKNGKDAIAVFSGANGTFLHKISLRTCNIKEIVSLLPLPHKPTQVAVLTNEKGSIMDIKTKKHVRSIPKWSGTCTTDGKFGLYAPSRGGLELLELKKGSTVKTFIPKVAEGVFTVICMFTSNDEYVLYYHSGRKTLRVFRTNDAEMIANYRMQAELTAIRSTSDGRSLVLGTVDGCISVLAIADPQKEEMQQFLKNLPSRDANWKKKLAKQKASARFKAAMRLASISTRFGTPIDDEDDDEDDDAAAKTSAGTGSKVTPSEGTPEPAAVAADGEAK
uniref:NWD2 C-terminal beta-propeller domain-containing protein n=1 Tax=Anopheles atroparvus TaxID=41427 RepID=A0AAG5DIR5_ANOAO